MTRFSALILALCLILSLVSCAAQDQTAEPPAPTEGEGAQSAVPEADAGETDVPDTDTTEEEGTPEDKKEQGDDTPEETPPADGGSTPPAGGTPPTGGGSTPPASGGSTPSTGEGGDTEHEHSFVLKSTTLTDCTLEWTEYYVCSCLTTKTVRHWNASHKWGETKTVVEPTLQSEGKAERTCTVCKKTESITLPKKLPYFVGLTVKEKKLLHSTSVRGTDLLSAVYGENSAFQTGDVLVYEVQMSDGSANGFEILGSSGCTCTVDQTRITVKITGEFGAAGWSLKTTDRNGREKVISTDYRRVYRTEKALLTFDAYMEDIFKDYAYEKHSIEFTNGLTVEQGYTAPYRGTPEDPSLTQNHGDGGCDDWFVKADHENWVEYTLWLLDQYDKLGITEWTVTVHPTCVAIIAAK